MVSRNLSQATSCADAAARMEAQAPPPPEVLPDERQASLPHLVPAEISSGAQADAAPQERRGQSIGARGGAAIAAGTR